MDNAIIKAKERSLYSEQAIRNIFSEKTSHVTFVNTARYKCKVNDYNVLITDEQGSFYTEAKNGTVEYNIYCTKTGIKEFSFRDKERTRIRFIDRENIFTFTGYSSLRSEIIIKFYNIKNKMLVKKISLGQRTGCRVYFLDNNKVYYSAETNEKTTCVECIDIDTFEITRIYEDKYISNVHRYLPDSNKICIILISSIAIFNLSNREIERTIHDSVYILAYNRDYSLLAERIAHNNSIQICRADKKDKRSITNIKLGHISDNHRAYCTIKTTKFSSDNKYIFIMYEKLDTIYVQINDVLTGEQISGLNSNQMLKLDDEFILMLKKLRFHEKDVEHINNLFGNLALDTINVEMICMHHNYFETAICPYTGNIAFENFSDKAMQVLDINDLEFTDVYKIKNDHTEFVLHRDMLLAVNNPNCKPENNHILYKNEDEIAEFSNKGYFVKHALAAKIAPSVRKKNLYKYLVDYEIFVSDSVCTMRNISGVSDINNTYLISLSKDKKKIIVHNYKSGHTMYASAKGIDIRIIDACYCTNMFFVTDNEMNMYKYKINDGEIIETGKLPFKRCCYEYFEREFMIVSADGKYIVTLIENELIVYDARTCEIVASTTISSKFIPNNGTELKHIDIKNRFIMIEFDDLSTKYLFLDLQTLNTLATLNIFSKGRFLWETPPDKIAENGWFFTDIPEMINVYSEDKDGNRALLDYNDERRINYLQKYNRHDMVRKRLLDSAEYQKSIKFLSQKKNNIKMLSKIKHNPLMICTDKQQNGKLLNGNNSEYPTSNGAREFNSQ